MSLLQLLTTGKSLVGLNDTEPRYRVTRERLLPEFGPARNPFCTTVKPSPEHPEAAKRQPALDLSERTVAGNSAPLPSLPAPSVPVTAALQSPTRKANAGRGGAGAALLRIAALPGRCVGKLKVLLSRAGSRPPARLGPPSFAKTPLQSELALERIKVVRNDLRDADLVVVPAKLPAVRGSIAPTVRGEQLMPGGGVSRRSLSGLLRAGKP